MNSTKEKRGNFFLIWVQLSLLCSFFDLYAPLAQSLPLTFDLTVKKHIILRNKFLQLTDFSFEPDEKLTACRVYP